MGCESLKFRNIVKTGTTTAITYAVAGPIPAVLNLGTNVLIDEVIPKDNKINDIETKEQAVAHVADSLIMYSLYGFIAFLLITNVLTPYFTRKWGYNEAKQKYKKQI
jgi:archaellum biogenesis protein FlaJ (TadC family)